MALSALRPCVSPVCHASHIAGSVRPCAWSSEPPSWGARNNPATSWRSWFPSQCFFSSPSIPNHVHPLQTSKLILHPLLLQTASAFNSYFTKNRGHLSWPCLTLTTILFLLVSRGKRCLFHGLLFPSPLGFGSINFLPPPQVPFIQVIVMLKPLFFHPQSASGSCLPCLPILFRALGKSGILPESPCLRLSFTGPLSSLASVPTALGKQILLIWWRTS